MKKLIVKNFGPVTDAEIEIRKMNLFIGEQSVGKSTLAKLIAVFTDYIHLWLLLTMKEQAWKQVVEVYELASFCNDSYSICYEEKAGDFTISVSISPKEVTATCSAGDNSITEPSELFAKILARKPIFHPVNVNDLMGKGANAALEYFRNTIYVPAERILANTMSRMLPVLHATKTTLPRTLTNFLIDLFNARDKYPQLDIPMFDVSFERGENSDMVRLKEGTVLPLKNASSGIQSALPLLLVTTYCINDTEYASYVVEEPECNLFPQKQIELLKLLISVTIPFDRTLTITTHSPYLLSALNNILYAGEQAESLTPDGQNLLAEIIDKSLWLKTSNCSVYSLGSVINHGVYCQSLIDSETGLIDYNSLDGISIQTSEEFADIQRILIREQRKAQG